MPLTPPSSPDGEQYEDFVVATLKALGYFTETRLTLREGKKEVLELDVVATPSGAATSDRELLSPFFEATNGQTPATHRLCYNPIVR